MPVFVNHHFLKSGRLEDCCSWGRVVLCVSWVPSGSYLLSVTPPQLSFPRPVLCKMNPIPSQLGDLVRWDVATLHEARLQTRASALLDDWAAAPTHPSRGFCRLGSESWVCWVLCSAPGHRASGQYFLNLLPYDTGIIFWLPVSLWSRWYVLFIK